jgi:hypothetical protein
MEQRQSRTFIFSSLVVAVLISKVSLKLILWSFLRTIKLCTSESTTIIFPCAIYNKVVYQNPIFAIYIFFNILKICTLNPYKYVLLSLTFQIFLYHNTALYLNQSSRPDFSKA